ESSETPTPENPRIGGGYAHYVLFVLIIVYVFNFVDRNILSILAEDIKADLGISDGQMGFLYGTVFAVFYAVFGIPLARFADVWNRRSLISLGLLVWSGMTALSGFARSFSVLALFRVGVGIGEASASPAAYSMLADYYPPRLRATVIALYSSGVYIGGGIGIMLGGWIVDAWSAAYPVDPPLGLRGWQAAFLAVGLPGILMAAWVRTLREPVRGISEGLVAEKHPHPFRVLGQEMMSVMPMLSLAYLARLQGSVRNNLLGLFLIVLAVIGLILLTGSVAQWSVLGVGAYITLTWAQALNRRDNATFNMIFGSKALIYTTLAFPTISFASYGLGFWVAPLLQRSHDVSASDVGFYIGAGNALAGLIGVSLGGYLADRWKLTWANGRLYVGFITVATTTPLVLGLLYTDSLQVAFWMNFLYHIPISMWVGIPPATTSDLVMPRMRAVAGAYYILVNTLIGLALGPYVIGQLSDLFVAQGMSPAAALQTAMAASLGIFVATLAFLFLAMRHLPGDEASRLQRARALGETVATERS
ncbi:MAG: MFS transporter, partial [Pseudomonadota bacterium]